MNVADNRSDASVFALMDDGGQRLVHSKWRSFSILAVLEIDRKPYAATLVPTIHRLS